MREVIRKEEDWVLRGGANETGNPPIFFSSCISLSLQFLFFTPLSLSLSLVLDRLGVDSKRNYVY
jgi:hypothetical protein